MHHQVRGMIFEGNAFLPRLGLAHAARNDNVAEQQFCLYNSFNSEISLIRHRKREDVRWLVLAAPLGIERADLIVAGQRDRNLDPPLSRGQLRVRAFRYRRLGSFSGELVPGAAAVPFLIGVERDLEHHRPGPSYAATMRPTNGWRTTSAAVKRTVAMPLTPSSFSTAYASPDLLGSGRSTWCGSPQITIRLRIPNRVRNIFICRGVVLCASSRMINATLMVRPRMKASGAIAITPDSIRSTN